MFKTVGKRKL